MHMVVKPVSIMLKLSLKCFLKFPKNSTIVLINFPLYLTANGDYSREL